MRKYILSREAGRLINYARIFSFAGRESRIKCYSSCKMSVFDIHVIHTRNEMGRCQPLPLPSLAPSSPLPDPFLSPPWPISLPSLAPFSPLPGLFFSIYLCHNVLTFVKTIFSRFAPYPVQLKFYLKYNLDSPLSIFFNRL